MSSFFSTLFSTVETVLTDVQVGTEAISPVAAVIPGAAPVVAAVEGGLTAVNALITQGQAIVTAASPELLALEAIFDSLFHITQAPQATVLTPTTTVATAAK